MYQVLLADDESSITNALQRSIDWEKYDLQVAAVVTNGQDALDIIDKTHIDIVITDIRMHKMGGLELCQQLHTKNPSIQTLIMSGYAEFSYAQRGMKYGVLGYCLKPLEYEEVSMYLSRAVQRLRAKGNHLSQDDFLDALLNKDINKMRACLNNYDFYEEYFYIAVATTDNPSPIDNGIILRVGRKQYAYLSKARLSNEFIQQFLANHQNKCLGLCSQPITVHELTSEVNNCQTLSNQFFIDHECRICENISDEKANLILNELIESSSFTNHNKTILILQKVLKDSSVKRTFTVKQALKLCNIVCSSNALIYEKDDYYAFSIEQLVNRYQNFDDLLHQLIDSLSIDYLPVSITNDLSNSSFLQMMDYITTHYQRDISLSDIADSLHLNPNYLSQVFKKEAGITFSKYLTDLRITKAKQLLNSGNVSISEVAMNVGFNDYFYFLKTFKRITGQTPSQFKLGG